MAAKRKPYAFQSKKVRPCISLSAEFYARLKAWSDANGASMTEAVDAVVEKECGEIPNVE